VLPAPRHPARPAGFETIFLDYDRLNCRKANLKVVTKQEARQHHRMRRDSKSGAKGVRYDPELGSRSAQVYRDGRCQHIGTYHSKEATMREEFHALLVEQQARALPKSTLGEAVPYALANWAALMWYTEQGYLAIDINLAERALR
jgi:hypothetical protein